jgi:two-component system, NtrC family, sensor kinase
VRDTLGLLAHKLEVSAVRVELDLACDLPLLWCDGAQIMQVIINLIANAAESMPGGGRMRIQTERDDAADSVVVRIHDSGPGIPEEALAHIFEPFFTTKEDGKGVGLGLAVVYGIVNAHGGSIDVQSRPGQGTTACVVLPVGSPEEEEKA